MQSTSSSFSEFKSQVHKHKSKISKDGDHYSEWMFSIKATLGFLTDPQSDSSIHKVPNKLRQLKEDAYKPHIVSIGPFHAGQKELMAFEEHKWRYMLKFLHRAYGSRLNENSFQIFSTFKDLNQMISSEVDNFFASQHPPIKALEECVQALLGMEQIARACYADNIRLEKHELVEMLLVDGCFLLELFSTSTKDPITRNYWMVTTLMHDLALVENQIPFFVLNKLFNIVQKFTINKRFPVSLNHYVLYFWQSALNLNERTVEHALEDIERMRLMPKHIPHLLHCVFKKPSTTGSYATHSTGITEWGFSKSATKLTRCGIKFQAGGGHDHLLDIKWDDDNGIITIPPLHISETTDKVFRNLIAFEHFNNEEQHPIASYAFLMKSLIHTTRDVELLKRKGIISTNLVGGDEEVKNFFTNLCREVVLEHFYFDLLCAYSEEYKLSWFRRDRIKGEASALIHNPWTLPSFIGALVLLLLTIVQTFFTVRSYYPH